MVKMGDCLYARRSVYDHLAGTQFIKIPSYTPIERVRVRALSC